MTDSELLKLKNDIDNAKIKVSELTGQQTALLAQLKEWDCKTVEEAEAKLKEMQTEIEAIDKKIEAGIKELQNVGNQ
jgi:flagellar biosynthesis chaperone FliJ